MTTRLEQAFTEASKLSPKEQDALADWVLAELRSEKQWDRLFASSQDTLSKLASEALAEHRKGNTLEILLVLIFYTHVAPLGLILG